MTPLTATQIPPPYRGQSPAWELAIFVGGAMTHEIIG